MSQLLVEGWYKMIRGSTHADAILDRRLHGSMGAWEHGSMGAWEHGSMGAWEHQNKLKGESMQKMQTSLTEGEQ
ncbi:hypothetical protein CCO48_24150 [Salmonella enterica subsp. enterica serovar Altendorf]|nr:hypothetical protein CCO48_24150 [Salmonella enterica subsp. enterica serovar Altendorf]